MKIHKMTDFSKEWGYKEVPDPYFGGEEGFELVLDLLEDACAGLLHTTKP
jgi:protein-tyrosine phosphatase